MARHFGVSSHPSFSLSLVFVSCPLLPTVFVYVSYFYPIVQILCVAIINSIGAIDITSDQMRCYFFYVRTHVARVEVRRVIYPSLILRRATTHKHLDC